MRSLPRTSAPTRFPDRLVRKPTAATIASARSRFSNSAVPKSRLAERSTTIHVSSSRSAIVSRTCGIVVRAVTGPVHAAHVVAHLVLAALPRLAARRGHEAEVVTLQQAVETAEHVELEAAERGLDPRCRRGAVVHAVRSSWVGPRSGQLHRSGEPGGTCAGHALLARRDPRELDRGDDAVDDVVGLDAVGQRFVREHDPVAQHLGGDVVDVLRKHVGAAADQRERPPGRDEPERGPRARSVRDHRLEVDESLVLRRTGREDEAHRVPDHRGIDVDAVDGALEIEQRVGVEHRLGRRRVDAHPGDDLELLGGRGVADDDLHEEPVALRFGQQVHAFGLDRVLRREHEEGVGHEVRDAGDRHLALGHHLEQRRLHLGGRTVDLVGEHEVGEHRAELDVERSLDGR